MCTVLLPAGNNPIAFNKYIVSYHIKSDTAGATVHLFIIQHLCNSITQWQNQNGLFSVRITDTYLELVTEETKRQKECTVGKRTHVTADLKLLYYLHMS